MYNYTLDCTSGGVLDVWFVIDSSRGIGFSRFQLVRELAENIIATVKVNALDSSAGVILFSSFASTSFDTLSYTSFNKLLPAINPGLSYYGYSGKRIGGALSYLYFHTIQKNPRSRSKISEVAIIITEGVASDPQSLQRNANLLHATTTIDIYAIGVGNNNITELELIASNPSFVFTTNSFNNFTAKQIEEDVLDQLCSSKYLRSNVRTYICIK